jgi:hypothetical protein
MMTKVDLRKAVERFFADPNRIVSVKLLCELAGISDDTFRAVFQTKITPMTPTTQVRMERALMAVERGQVKVFKTPDRVHHIAYKRKAEPEFKRGFSLTMKNGQIAVKTGLINANNYRTRTFKEELEG